MKYKLLPIGEPCSDCGCCQGYKLVEDHEGYDLIQFKRGNQVNFGGLVLQPGEPAIVLDTGKFYIGGPGGVPYLVNSSSAEGSLPLAANDNDFTHGELISIPYSSMITPEGILPTATDAGKYLTILVINQESMPVGQGYLVNWNFTTTSAQFRYAQFRDGFVGQLVFQQATESDAWVVYSELWDTEQIVNMEVWDLEGNPIGVQYEVIDQNTVHVVFVEPTAGQAVFYYNI